MAWEQDRIRFLLAAVRDLQERVTHLEQSAQQPPEPTEE